MHGTFYVQVDARPFILTPSRTCRRPSVKTIDVQKGLYTERISLFWRNHAVTDQIYNTLRSWIQFTVRLLQQFY